MKISLIVIIILTTLLCVLPIIGFMLVGKNATRKKEKAFRDLLKKDNLTLSQEEQWNNNFIGIDEGKKVLAFIKLNALQNHISKIDLKDLKSCQINKVTRDFKRDKKVESELQTIQLELTFNTSKPKEFFDFYDIQEQLSEDFELKRAEKWEHIINQNIPKSKTNSLAA